MPELNWLAVVAAAVIVFVVSSLYYVAVAARLVDLTPPEGASGGGMAPWKMGVELIRNLVLATVVAGLTSLLGITDLAGGLQLGLALWVGFPVILLLGSVIWESVEPMRAAAHAGDWFLKLMIVAAIVAIWR